MASGVAGVPRLGSRRRRRRRRARRGRGIPFRSVLMLVPQYVFMPAFRLLAVLVVGVTVARIDVKPLVQTVAPRVESSIPNVEVAADAAHGDAVVIGLTARFSFGR